MAFVIPFTIATTGKVIDLVASRDSQSATKLCNSLTFEQRRRVLTVCTDMWQPYISAVANHFPRAKHCFDNFHLVGYLNKAVDKVRRSEVKKFDELRNSKYLFLKELFQLLTGIKQGLSMLLKLAQIMPERSV